jgi:hypothetical protein
VILNWKNDSPMSSATSTDPVSVSAVSTAASASSASTSTFKPWHFFVILTLLAATAAVLTARRTSPENLIMVSLTVFAAGAAAVAMYRTLLPLVGRERTLRADTLGHRARVALEREKSLVLRSIKELEFDRAMGKLADADFDEMSARLRARALGLMRQLEASDAVPRERIERELADRLSRDSQRRASRGGEARMGAAAASAGPAAAATATADAAPAGTVCAACGTSNDGDARFCKECGTRLASGATHA